MGKTFHIGKNEQGKHALRGILDSYGLFQMVPGYRR
jgi:hypothetical protein